MRGLLAALLLIAAACGCNPGWAIDGATRAELMAAGRASPVRKLETWASWLARPTEERIAPASEALLEYLEIDNRLLGYPGIPKASTDPELRGLLRTALEELPPGVLRLVDDRLTAIIIVRDLGSSGFTDIVRDTDGNPVAAFVVLDETLFTRRANAWATWRDSTVFRSSPTKAATGLPSVSRTMSVKPELPRSRTMMIAASRSSTSLSTPGGNSSSAVRNRLRNPGSVLAFGIPG